MQENNEKISIKLIAKNNILFIFFISVTFSVNPGRVFNLIISLKLINVNKKYKNVYPKIP